MTLYNKMGELLRQYAAKWTEDADFVCKTCKEPARKELKGAHRWACLKCDGTTVNPDLCFVNKKTFVTA